MKSYAIVLAAGKGTRMKTTLPKCAYPLLKKPMIAYIVENLKNTELVNETIVVVGHKKEVIHNILNNSVSYAVQEEQLGTGHAVKMAKDLVTDKEGYTIILPGDMPLIDASVLKAAIDNHQKANNDLTIVTTIVEDPFGYGRIIRNGNNIINKIVEENDEMKPEIRDLDNALSSLGGTRNPSIPWVITLA